MQTEVVPRRVTVVGSGVVGLSVAYRLAGAGHLVTVLTDRPAAETVSAVAAAIWFPYAIENTPESLAQLTASRRQFEALADDPATGVLLRDGVLVERSTGPDRRWTEAVGEVTEATAAELPAGAVGGVRVRLPVIEMQPYLEWLASSCSASGVRIARAHVADLRALCHQTDAVVVAAGLGSGRLLGDDDTVVPIRGQVVRLRNPGLTDWVLDDDYPGGMVYVIPRRGDVVCGGTAQVANTDLTWNRDDEEQILRRAIDVVPALAGQPIVSRGVGLRPSRPVLRIERVDGWPVPVIACYGHGGAGVSASWGSADLVRELVALP